MLNVEQLKVRKVNEVKPISTEEMERLTARGLSFILCTKGSFTIQFEKGGLLNISSGEMSLIMGFRKMSRIETDDSFEVSIVNMDAKLFFTTAIRPVYFSKEKKNEIFQDHKVLQQIAFTSRQYNNTKEINLLVELLKLNAGDQGDNNLQEILCEAFLYSVEKPLKTKTTDIINDIPFRYAMLVLEDPYRSEKIESYAAKLHFSRRKLDLELKKQIGMTASRVQELIIYQRIMARRSLGISNYAIMEEFRFSEITNLKSFISRIESTLL